MLFEAENKELEEVLTFIKDMIEIEIEIDINTKIYKSEYPPSELWRNWSEQQKVSISIGSNIIMLNSGHSFTNSEVKQTLPKNNLKKIFKIFKIFLESVSKKNIKEEIRIQATLFKSLYPKFKYNSDNYALKLHPFSFFKYIENSALRDKFLPNNYKFNCLIEIGSGAGVSLNERYNLNSYIRQISIDLPDTIIPAYLFLKSVNNQIRILLPNQLFRSNAREIINDFLDISKPKKYDIIFITPDMAKYLPNNSFDHAFNSSSFQEMENEVFKNYFKLIERTLKVTCYFESNNSSFSRYIKGNNINSWGKYISLKLKTKIEADFTNISHNRKNNIKDYNQKDLIQLWSLFVK